MAIAKALVFATLLCLTLGDATDQIFPGPVKTSSVAPPTDKPTTTSSTSTSSSTPTTPSTTTISTPKPTTPTTPPTTSSTTPSTTTTPKPTTTTTTPTPTTPTPKPTTPTPDNPVGKWVANYTNTNRTCMVLEGALEVEIKYQVGNATKNVTVKIPPTAKVTKGLCDDKNAENITLGFDATNAINFNFKKSGDGKKFDVESVVVMLNVTLPGVNDSQILVLGHDKDEFSTPVSHSYKCAKEQSLNLTAQTKVQNYTGLLRISHFQVQAFRNASSTKFDEAMDCATAETPDVVPIAVGCALAALVVIVLIAYLIGRRRSQARGYLSM